MISDRNLWAASAREQFISGPVSQDSSVDLVIVGAGFTGLNAAIEAAARGASVIVLEAEQIAFGGSGRNVGLVNAGLWLPPDTVIAKLGPNHGPPLVEALGKGPGLVFERIEKFGIDCEANRCGTLHLAHSPAGMKDLQDRYAQGIRHGTKLILHEKTATAQLTGSGAFHGALFDPRAGTIQPRSYALGLARIAQEQAVRIHERSPVRRLAHHDGMWITEVEGHKIRSASVIIATNAYHRFIDGIAAPEFVPVSYCQFATAPLSPAQLQEILPEKHGCWDTAMIMSSFRLDAAGRLILGGIGNTDGIGAGIHKNWARRKLAKIFPALAKVAFEYSWSGNIAMTKDNLPKIIRFGPEGYMVFGYSGRGIAPGTVFGSALGRLVTGDDTTALPLPLVHSHHEAAKGMRAAFYETGAIMMHAINPAPV